MTSFQPLKKKRHSYDQFGTPFPIPLAALTGVPASAANWHSYEAKFSQGIVTVLNPEHAEALWHNGYFGKGKASAQNHDGESQWKQRHKTWKLIEYDGLKLPNEKKSEQQCDSNSESFEPKDLEKRNDVNVNMDSPCDSQGEIFVLNEENNDDNKLEKNEDVEYIGQSNMSDNICKGSNSFENDGKILLVLHSDRSGVMSNAEGEKQLEYEYRQEMDNFCENGDEESSRTSSVIDVTPAVTPASLILTLEETMFLSYALGCLTLHNDQKHELSIDDMWKEFIKEDIRFAARYAVYHHFRAKGWVVKPGLKFGSDWVLYPVGPSFYHAHFTVTVKCLWADTYAVDESLNWREMSWTALSATERLTTHVNKTPILALVLRPRNITRIRLNHISCLKEMKIKEVLLSRWNPDPNGQEESL